MTKLEMAGAMLVNCIKHGRDKEGAVSGGLLKLINAAQTELDETMDDEQYALWQKIGEPLLTVELESKETVSTEREPK